MERVFIGVSRAEATRKADEWWGRQKGLRQTLRTEVAVGGKGPDAPLDQWAITIRFEDENSGLEWRSAERHWPFVIQGQQTLSVCAN